jgi:Flp pilus assembly protein TadB
MSVEIIQIAVLAVGAAGIMAFFSTCRRTALMRLETLESCSSSTEAAREIFSDSISLKLLSDSLGRAGAVDFQRRRQIILKLCSIVLAGTAVGLAFSILRNLSIAGIALLTIAGAIGGGLVAVLYLKRQQCAYERRILFFLPLVMEQLILLIESGLGLLPALHGVLDIEEKQEKRWINPVQHTLSLIYRISAAGVPFGIALEQIASVVPSRPLRHVLLHLDIGAAEGGEMVPALRGLSDHCHREWKHSVEGRIKKLENAVIFPVFLAVIGLMLLVAAVPLVPLIELRQHLDPVHVSVVSKDVPIFENGALK